ncbi:hypothetical protein HK105_208810 [Polyrhizophydium stewartii]|uniref:GH26 domain-containing protein n=1 Tax=Polyrhizophydium stewartii TaxID=2732419 RepID=A0ABR4MWR2_9FUNG|nr:hypothetical protein HK105_008146 [Polyrhizophydium stewartii]
MGNRVCMSRRTLAFFFWLKATFAMALSMAGLGYMVYRIYVLHRDAVAPIGTTPKSVPIPIDPASAVCRRSSSLAPLEPPTGNTLIGYHYDWSYDTPALFANRVGLRPAVVNAFMAMQPSATNALDWNMLSWHAWQVSLVGGIFQLSIMPTTLTGIPDEAYTTIAAQIKAINSERGVPMIVRFGHEMNGNWMTYGYKPSQYTTEFRRITNAIRAQTNMTAMMWAPNIGLSYPWTTGGVIDLPTAATDPTNFALMDTNGDGKLDGGDDPYGPYYPGDEYVDWVGISLYWYISAGANTLIQDGYIYANLKGSITGDSAVGLNLTARNFYDRFASAKNKPMALPESGAPWVASAVTAATTTTELLVKQSWWTQVLSTQTLQVDFPLLKLVVNFEEKKTDTAGTADNDWRVGNSSVVYTPYASFINSKTNLVLANRLSFSCGGTLSVS